ncbi:MAG TPA: hypothetical protein VKB19_06080 [Pedobacter sp.]|nr:hypothetical protein [Pedobacter sp.]
MTGLKKTMACLMLCGSLAGTVSAQDADNTTQVNPYLLTVESKPYLLRSYMMFEGKKRTHVISVGTPQKISYSYDLKSGALLQVWKGQFVDVKEMWHERGEPQLAKPLGQVLALSGAPAIAILNNKDAMWPDSIGFDELQNKGYTLDKSKMPTFIYAANGAEVSDRIAILNNGEGLERSITVNNAKDQLFCRIAAATTIKSMKGGVYEIGDKTYLITLDKALKPFIRNTAKGQELLLPVKKGTSTLTYSLTW